MIVAAALVDNCWERIEEARDAKLLSFNFLGSAFFSFADTPILHNPDCAITGSKRGLISMIKFAICRADFLAGDGCSPDPFAAKAPPMWRRVSGTHVTKPLLDEKPLVFFRVAVYF
jgi:hypothetical protein